MNKSNILTFVFTLLMGATLTQCAPYETAIPGTNSTITSSVDLSKLQPDENGNYDLRPLEEELAKKNHTFFQRHLGKIGFCAGVLVAYASYALCTSEDISGNLREIYFYLVRKI